jgi:hypothetical protein
VIVELVARMRQGRIYANLHTSAFPGGEVRGQVQVRGRQVSHYSDPEFSWKFEVAPVGLGFLEGRGLGREYEGDLFVGEARTFLQNGFLFKFDLARNRRDVRTFDPRLADDVADNKNKFDLTESETLQFGQDFGITAEILTGPNGTLFVLSLSDGILREIHRPSLFGAAPVFGPSLLPGEADPLAPTQIIRTTPRRASAPAEATVESDNRAPRREGPVVIEVRAGLPDGGPQVLDDDPLALDPIVVG